MFEYLISEPLVANIINLSKQIDESILFHQKSHDSLKCMGDLDFISKVFEANLMNENFITKKWADYEIPHLVIYQDYCIDMKYHIFSPCSSGNNENASYLIHHHGNNTLSSFVFFGSGYKSIHFDKEILKSRDGSFNLKVNRTISHINGNIIIVPKWVPHLVSNVKTTTATVVLWSQDEKNEAYSNMTDEIRMSYFYENGRFFGINEKEFISKINNMLGFEIESEKHIQAICYLMQQKGYANNVFLKKIVNNVDTPKSWVKYLNLLILEENIGAPIFNMKINTLNKEILIKK